MWVVDLSRVITAEQKQTRARDALLSTFEDALVRHLDAMAQERQYDSALSITSYAGSSNNTWRSEAQAFTRWRDEVWTYALAELAKVQAGGRPVPAVEDFIAELPLLQWPTA